MRRAAALWCASKRRCWLFRRDCQESARGGDVANFDENALWAARRFKLQHGGFARIEREQRLKCRVGKFEHGLAAFDAAAASEEMQRGCRRRRAGGEAAEIAAAQ